VSERGERRAEVGDPGEVEQRTHDLIYSDQPRSWD